MHHLESHACGWLWNAGHGTIRTSAYAVVQQLALDWQEVEQQVMDSTLTKSVRRMQVRVAHHAGVTDVKTHGDGSEGWHS